MPRNVEVDEAELAELREGGGVAKETQKARDKAFSDFDDFVKKKVGSSIDSVIKEREKGSELVVNLLGEYFFTLRVDGGNDTAVWPKKSYADKIRSHIKQSLIIRYQLDPTDPGKFPDAPRRWKSFVDKLAKEVDKTNTELTS